MSANYADSNLLFGIIALQMDFVDRDALIEAMQAWTLDKEKHLGDILVDQDRLTLQRQALLEELVQEHLKQHGDDPAASLGAISADSSVKEALQSIDDIDIHEAITYASDATPDDVHATQLAPSALELDQRFRVLRPHAQGGLGQVSVALDKELQREVALKELQMKFASSEATRERFMLEAAVTGGLEHPGIVPVYGLGHYSDGRPYYAMRFIRGDNLKEAIEQFHRDTSANHNLGLRKLLRRFVDVCDAIQYAHSRGILHRDLKPGNIMLGKYGETLVVDWGLAKPVDSAETPTMIDVPPLQVSSGSGSAPTSMGSIIGTPGYMSPEQAAGRLDLLGPATDVYGLGATLYHLLTGEPPFRAKTSEILKKVERGDFKRPREVRGDVPQALEAICLKAMSTRADDRYESAFRLAEDIEHWLADESVSAWPEPVTVRLGRWVRRHTTLVSSVAAAACVGVLVMAASFVLIQAAYQREQASHALARQVIDDYFTTVAEATLLNQPGMQDLRRDLLARATSHYEHFAAEHEGNRELQEELGEAYYRLGVIREALDTYSDAIAAYDRAALIQRRLVSDFPTAADWFYDLGLTLNARGRVLHKQNLTDQAGLALQDAIDIREEAAKIQPENVAYARTLANSHMNYGEVLRVQGKVEEAQEQFSKADELRGNALQRTPDNFQLRRDAAKGHYNSANAAFDQGQMEAARQHLSAAVESFDQLRQESPRDTEILGLTAQAYRRLGDLQRLSQAYEKAQAAYHKALEIAGHLAFHNPSVRDYRETHAAVLLNLGSTMFERQPDDAAVAKYEQASEIYKKLIEDFDEDERYRVEQANAQVNLGRTLLWLERPQVADAPLRDATRLLEHAGEPPSTMRACWIWAEARHYLGMHKWSAGDLAGALDELEAGQAALDSWLEVHGDDSEYANWNLKNQAAIYALATVAQQHGETSRRAGWQAKSESVLESLEQPATEQLHEAAAQHLHTIARLQWAGQRLPQAVNTLRIACERLADAAVKDAPVEVRQQLDALQGDLAALLLDLARQQLDSSQEEAKKSILEARNLLLPLVEAYPDDEYYRQDLQAAGELIGQLESPSEME